MRLLKIACPYCWQHFEIDEAEQGENYECFVCGNSFNGREAPVLAVPNRCWKAVCVLFVLSLILLAANVSLPFLRRCLKSETAEPVPAVRPAEFVELSRQVKELEGKLAALAKKQEMLEKREIAKPPPQPVAANDETDAIRSIFLRLGRLENEIAKQKDASGKRQAPHRSPGSTLP